MKILGVAFILIVGGWLLMTKGKSFFGKPLIERFPDVPNDSQQLTKHSEQDGSTKTGHTVEPQNYDLPTKMSDALIEYRNDMVVSENRPSRGTHMFTLWARAHMKWDDVKNSQIDTKELMNDNKNVGKITCANISVRSWETVLYAQPNGRLRKFSTIIADTIENDGKYPFAAVVIGEPKSKDKIKKFCGVYTQIYTFGTDRSLETGPMIVGMFEDAQSS